MKTFQFFAFAAAAALTLSTSSCSKKENVAPAAPQQAAVASADAVQEPKVLEFTTEATGNANIYTYYKIDIPARVTVYFYPTANESKYEFAEYPTHTGNFRGFNFKVKYRGSYRVELHLDRVRKQTKFITVR